MLGFSEHGITLFDFYPNKFLRYAEEDKEIERERKEAGKNNY